MSTDTPTADPANPLAAAWAPWLEQSNHQVRAFLEVLQAAGDPQQVQKRWLEAMSQSLDDFMRTPAFLEAIRQNLKTMTDLKGLQDRLVQDAACHVGVPLSGDITGLFERLHGVEQTILTRLEGIASRLEAIEARLGTAP